MKSWSIHRFWKNIAEIKDVVSGQHGDEKIWKLLVTSATVFFVPLFSLGRHPVGPPPSPQIQFKSSRFWVVILLYRAHSSFLAARAGAIQGPRPLSKIKHHLNKFRKKQPSILELHLSNVKKVGENTIHPVIYIGDLKTWKTLRLPLEFTQVARIESPPPTGILFFFTHA